MATPLIRVNFVLAIGWATGIGALILYLKGQSWAAMLIALVAAYITIVGIKARALVLHHANVLPKEERTLLVTAVTSLSFNDTKGWNQLPVRLKKTDVGVLCEAFLASGDSQLLNKAGEILGGPQWRITLYK